jgi:hypothetical protein
MCFLLCLLIIPGLAGEKSYSGLYFLSPPSVFGVSQMLITGSSGLSQFLVFSGSEDSESYFSNIINIAPSFSDSTTNRYISYTSSSTKTFPDSRAFYAMVQYTDPKFGNTAVVYGGIGQNGVLGDTWQYIIDNDMWIQVSNSLRFPLYNFGFTSVQTQNDTIVYIAGGLTNSLTYSTKTYS